MSARLLTTREELARRRASWQCKLFARVHNTNVQVAAAPADLLAGGLATLAPKITLRLSVPLPAAQVHELIAYGADGAEERVWHIAWSVRRWAGQHDPVGPELVAIGLQLHEQLPRLACFFRGRSSPLLVLPAPGRQEMPPAVATVIRDVLGYAPWEGQR